MSKSLAVKCQTPFFVSLKIKKENKDASPHILSKLPKRPYCTNDLQAGLKIRPLSTALKYRYIQLNHLVVNYLIFDIDRPGAALAHESGNVAAPNLIVINKENQHAHLIYKLQKGISKFPDSSLKALRYLAAIEAAYTLKLQADAGYAGLITKNPLNPFWTTWNIHNRQYDLAELADYVDLLSTTINKNNENEITYGLGRNCGLFDNGRFWAYGAVREYRQDKMYQDFFKAVLLKLQSLNSLFLNPLPINEVISTAKSIARWTWTHDKEAYNKFIERQRFKSAKGNKVKSDLSNDKKLKAIELKNAGYSILGIARKLGISRQWIYNYIKD